MWEIRSDMVDYPGHLLDAFLCLFVQLIYQHIGRLCDEREMKYLIRQYVIRKICSGGYPVGGLQTICIVMISDHETKLNLNSQMKRLEMLFQMILFAMLLSAWP